MRKPKSLALTISVDHRIFNHMERLVELNFAIDLFYNVVFNQNQPIYFYMDCKPVRVETSWNFLVDLNEYVVCWLFYRSLTVFLRYWVNKF